MLWHKDATMTLNLYGHLMGSRIDEVADAMDEARRRALGGKDGKEAIWHDLPEVAAELVGRNGPTGI